jgi:hypothetical protein
MFAPPATSTRPLASSVDVWAKRAAAIGNVLCQRRAAGSNSSADAWMPAKLKPPLTSTRPSGSRVAG